MCKLLAKVLWQTVYISMVSKTPNCSSQHPGEPLRRTVRELEEEFPELLEVVRGERDAYLAAKLYLRSLDHINTVAVVGQLHVDGIAKKWVTISSAEEATGIIRALERPVEKSQWALSSSSMAAVAVTAIVLVRYFYHRK